MKGLFRGSTTKDDEKGEEQKRAPNKLQKKRPPALPSEATGRSSSRQGEQRTPNKLQKKRRPALAIEAAGESSSWEGKRRAPDKFQEKRTATDLGRVQSMLDSVTPDENSENSSEKFQEVARTLGGYFSHTQSVRDPYYREDRRRFVESYLMNQKFGDPARWMASFKLLQLIEFILRVHPLEVTPEFFWIADSIVNAASHLAVLLTDSYQKSRIEDARISLIDNLQRISTGQRAGLRRDWMKSVLEKPDPRRMAETASSLGSPSPETSDRGAQQSGNGGPTRWPLETVDVDIGTKKMKVVTYYTPFIQEQKPLNGHDLEKIDLTHDAELSSTITGAYHQRQSGRAQKESEKELLLNELPKPKRIINQSTRSGKVASDLVRDSKLETIIASNGSVVRHISYVSNPRMRQRRMKKEETWRRQKKLGSGSFGCVWLEERLDGDDTGRLRAVKEITKSREGKGSDIDYNRELEAIAKFSHSKYVHCFVQSFGWYESENTIFITMEYIEKGDLQSYLVRPFPEEEVKQIAFQVLEGLDYMHENGFAHRDLKPANILVSEPSPKWWVKISDFGISKRAEEEATAYRTFVGTRGYLAPEILGIYSLADMNNISSSQTLDDSSSLYTVSVDLWALGAIIYRLVTNEILFGDPRDLARYVVGGHPFPRATASELGASEACVEFLENIMARSPNSRPSSSEALLHPWLSELQDPVDTTIDALEELSVAVEDSRTEHTIVDTSVASAQWPTSLG